MLIKLGVLAGAVVAAVSLGLASPVSAAAPGYPPSLLPATCSGAASAIVEVTVGSTENATEDSTQEFGPGSAVAISLNGQPVETVTANAEGLVELSIAVTDSSGTPEVSINGTAAVPAHLGVNTLTEAGVDATQGQDGTLTCASTLTLDPPSGNGGSASGNPSGSGPLAFTGLDLEALLSASALLVVAGVAIVVVTRRKARRYSTS